MFDVWSRDDLRRSGMTARAITGAVRTGGLIRPRQGCYLPSDAPDRLVRAVRVGGRLACVSLLAELGVFVLDATRLHVHMQRGDSRMRTPDGGASLASRPQRPPMLHWRTLSEPPTTGSVSVVDALIDATRCQEPRFAIATLDSALQLGLVDLDGISEVFEALPARFAALRPMLDGRAQSGPETLVRLVARRLGCEVALQVPFPGVGVVDLVIDDWLVIECDSRQFHGSWEQQRKDYRRDRRLAELGYCVLRLTAEDILWHPEVVVAALAGLLRARGLSRSGFSIQS